MASFEFAGHLLDLRQGRLRRGRVDVQLRHKSFLLLAYLMQNRGRVVSKDELVSVLWPEVVVSEGSLTQCIADIRRCLGPEARSLIRAVPRRGYILDESDVQAVMSDAIDMVPPRPGAPQPGPALAAPDAARIAAASANGDGQHSAFAGAGRAGEAAAKEPPEIQALRNVPMLAFLDAPKLTLVAFTSDQVTLAKGEVLFRQGDEANAAYIILSGALDAYLEAPGRRVHLSRNTENAIVGEMGLIDNAPRSATLIAASDVVALRIAKAVFLGLVAEVPTMALAIMREQIARLKHAEKRLKD